MNTSLVAIYRTNAVKNADGTLTGNYSGYDATGALVNRVHIPKAVAESFGLDKAGVVYPLFAVVSQETFSITDDSKKPVLDANGDQKTFQQNRAGSLFTTMEGAVSAVNANAKLNATAKADLASTAKALNLTAEAMVELATSPF